MRRPGRRIEIWFANLAKGKVRKKGPSYRDEWEQSVTVQFEIKLHADCGDGTPRFYVYGGDRRESFERLADSRKYVHDEARKLADERSTANWRDVILISQDCCYSKATEIRAFDFSFVRALVAEERVRYWGGEAFGDPESFHCANLEFEFDERFWEELAEMGELETWFEGRDDEWNGEESIADAHRVSFVLRYLRGRSRLLRDLRDGATRRVTR